MTGLAEVAPRSEFRMNDSQIASALALALNATPSVRAEMARPLPELRDKLRAGAKAIMQMWRDLDDEELFTKVAVRREQALAERAARELQGAS